MIKKITIAALIAAASITAAHAAEAGAYVGASLGYINGSADDSDFGAMAKNQSGAAYKLFGGYQFSKFVAAEAAYTDLGSFDFTYAGSGFTVADSYRIKSYSVAAVGTLPLGDFSVFAKLGATYNMAKSEVRATVGSSVGTSSDSKNKTDLLLGVGAGYAITKNVEARVEYENFGKAGDDYIGHIKNLYTVTGGLVYRF